MNPSGRVVDRAQRTGERACAGPRERGAAYVTSLVNAVMEGPAWRSTVIFLTWDDWGGFYDHVVPPVVDGNGYGLRVPPRHQPVGEAQLHRPPGPELRCLSEVHRGSLARRTTPRPRDRWRPDPRPTVRENAPQLGNLLRDFRFGRHPRRPLLLPTSRLH